MTLLLIQLTQTVTGAVITIIGLLLVAVIIGYFTAWFYARSVYTPVILGLEADKTSLNKQVTGLNNDIGKLNSKVDELNVKINSLQEEAAKKDDEIKKLTNKKKKPDIL
jgi:peptidoglycan hydrolase CwlO-like protein